MTGIIVDGYLTPDNVPEDSQCRMLKIPNSTAWLSVFMGALYPLTLPESWQQYGTLTPEEAAQAALNVIWDAYDVANQDCYGNCSLPVSGSRILRLNTITGKLEELDLGEWTTPAGDYAVPPITPREGGTPADQRCLAAANAAHVLELLYESITDSISSELEVAEALTAMIEAFIAAVGWEFAPIAAGLAAVFLVVFAVVYAVVALIGADLWDSTFTDVLVCALYNCSSNTDGVVTFDWPCVQNALAAGTDALNFDQLRLFNQLNFIIQVIGGADGLNLAGATTAITSATCDCPIDISGQITFDEDGDSYTLTQYPGVAGVSTLDTGFGQPAPSAKSYLASNGMWTGIRHDFDVPVTLTDFDFWYYYNDNTTPGTLVRNFRFYDSSDTLIASYQTVLLAGPFNTWNHYLYTGQNVENVSYFIVSTGVSAGAGFTGTTWVDNIAWAGIQP